MRSTLRLAGVVVLTSIVPGALAQDPAPPRRPSPARRRPIHDSIDRAVDAVVLAHLKPCTASERQGIPCFPVTVEEEGPRFSVAEALRRYRADGSPSPSRPPTVADMLQHYPGKPGAPAPAIGSVGPFDPVCTTKNLLRKLSGKNTTYHLYRLWDAGGERPMLTDRLLDPNTFRSNPDVHYEYLGKFDGECEAVAAWRSALRKATEPKPVPDDAWEETPRPPE